MLGNVRSSVEQVVELPVWTIRVSVSVLGSLVPLSITRAFVPPLV